MTLLTSLFSALNSLVKNLSVIQTIESDKKWISKTEKTTKIGGGEGYTSFSPHFFVGR